MSGKSKSIPERVETERLTIRPPVVDDVPVIYQAVRESLAELSPWMAWASDDYSLAGCEENIRGAIANFVTRERSLRYHFHDKDSGDFIAGSGFQYIDWRVPKLEIGYWCRSSKRGRGYVSEGVSALKDLALNKLGARRLELRCDARNQKSIAVAERCGFKLEGILKNEARNPAGELRDTCVTPSQNKAWRYSPRLYSVKR